LIGIEIKARLGRLKGNNKQKIKNTEASSLIKTQVKNG